MISVELLRILMDWTRTFIFLIIALLLAGCRQAEEAPAETPTPFTSTGITAQAPIGEPITISLGNLAANPALFEGSNLRLRGQYQRQPKLICGQDAFPSPATWGLVGEGLLANATGLDRQLTGLIDEGQEITVEGRWLRYDGPVGCGKTAPVQEVWYLSVKRVVDPHPMARSGQDVTIPAATEIAQLGAPATAVDLETEATAVPLQTPTPLPTIAEAPTLAPSPTAQVLTLTPTAQANITATAITATPLTMTPTPAQDGTAVATLTPAGSGTPETATATVENSQTTATATATVEGQDPSLEGEMEYEDLIMGQLEGSEIHNWNLSLEAAEAITITVAPSSGANIVLSVFSDSGQVLVDKQDQAAAGEVETITNLNVLDIDSVRVQIATDPQQQTDYALMALADDSYNFSFMGSLDWGMQRSDSLGMDHDHFWFFNATDGDSITMQVRPSGNEDPYVELYGPDGALLQTVDDTGSGEAEELSNFSILASGMYAVRVGEFDFEPMSYQIVVDNS